MEELEGTIAGCVHYRKNVLEAHLTPPPAPWADLAEGFARIDSAVGVESWMARLGRWLAAPPARRWALSADRGLLLAAGLFYQFRETPSVQAATLLQRAVTVAATHARPARPVRMRTNIKNRALIPAMLRNANYNSEAPLSAKSFQEWRDGLASKRDEVTTVPDPRVARAELLPDRDRRRKRRIGHRQHDAARHRPPPGRWPLRISQSGLGGI